MKNDLHDLELALLSHTPIVAIESAEENRVIGLLQKLSIKNCKPLYQWSVASGLERLDLEDDSVKGYTAPQEILNYINTLPISNRFVLLDFHPYLEEPVHVRILKEIALKYESVAKKIILLSHKISIPSELEPFSARFRLSMPGPESIEEIVREVAREWSASNPGKKVNTDQESFDLLIRSLAGVTRQDAKRLARNAIYDDGAITKCDLPEVAKAKYELIGDQGVLSFEYDTASFSQVAGLERLKKWLDIRKSIFVEPDPKVKLDPPRGVLLLGVQGCGKSLAAKAVAGTWHLPLLRLDFGAIYDKFIGETERKLQESLEKAELMAPCVLWMDEIEKGVGTGDQDAGTSRRVLGKLLTWLAEKKKPVFLVATSNDISLLPPELVRKGRFDEIFFVDLPSKAVRSQIFSIHLARRELDPASFDLDTLSELAEGFSGSEIEQSIVSALYSAHAKGDELLNEHIVEELKTSRPLSVVMSEKIEELRQWASTRTVPADSAGE